MRAHATIRSFLQMDAGAMVEANARCNFTRWRACSARTSACNTAAARLLQFQRMLMIKQSRMHPVTTHLVMALSQRGGIAGRRARGERKRDRCVTVARGRALRRPLGRQRWQRAEAGAAAGRGPGGVRRPEQGAVGDTVARGGVPAGLRRQAEGRRRHQASHCWDTNGAQGGSLAFIDPAYTNSLHGSTRRQNITTTAAEHMPVE